MVPGTPDQGPTAEGKIVYSQDFEHGMEGVNRSPASLPADRLQITDDPLKQRGKVMHIEYRAGDNFRTSPGTRAAQLDVDSGRLRDQARLDGQHRVRLHDRQSQLGCLLRADHPRRWPAVDAAPDRQRHHRHRDERRQRWVCAGRARSKR
jgi:hypothetical protein